MQGPYKTIYFSYDSPIQVTELLNQKYADGYDLVTFSEFLFIFKRREEVKP